MKLLIVAQETPYPPTHGGRADIWRRILALRALGHTLMVVTWAYAGRGGPSPEADAARLAAECAASFVFPIDQTPVGFGRRIPHLLTLPSHVAARVLRRGDYDRVREAAAGFAPDAILLDGFQGAWLAERLARELDQPLIYRAHNREHDYLTGQRRLARSWRGKLGLALAALHLKRLETELHRRSRVVLDISQEDLEHWRSRGFDNGVWAPPLADPTAPPAASAAPDIDLVYLGNLRTPNNVDGVTWFLEQALPRLRASRPDVTVLIAGSNPADEIRALCRRAGVILEADAAAPAATLARGRVLINPVWMSSGVNVKMVDMAVTGAPIVSTSHGMKGLPTQLKQLFAQADDAESFAAACDRLIDSKIADRAARRDAAVHGFGPETLRVALAKAQIV